MTARRRRRERLANSSTNVGCSTSQTVGDDEDDEGITGNDRHTLCCPTMSRSRKFVSLGLFIIDEFAFADAAGKPNGRSLSPQERVFSSFIIPRSSGLFVAHSTFRLAVEALMQPLAPACGKLRVFHSFAPVG